MKYRIHDSDVNKTDALLSFMCILYVPHIHTISSFFLRLNVQLDGHLVIYLFLSGTGGILQLLSHHSWLN